MRSHYCGQVNEKAIGTEVTVAGWVHRRRDHGGVIFIDLRDREGLLQIVFDPDAAKMFEEAGKLRNEFVIRVRGLVRARPTGTENANLASGRVELLARELEVLNRSEPLPFQLDETVGEETRLKYRYPRSAARRHEPASAVTSPYYPLDARLPGLERFHRHRDADARQDDTGGVRATTWSRAGLMRVSSSRCPQSPQIYKQLLMVAGFDRYYQIVRCFRDEDLRADRQPEFTQLDIETSFLTQNDIMGVMEGLVRHFFKEVLNVDLPNPLPRMTYAEAMRRYASDKPDLRIPARARRCRRPRAGLRLQGVRGARPRIRAVAWRLCVSPAATRCRVRRSMSTPRLSGVTVRRASRTLKSTSARRDATGCNLRS